MQTKSKKPRKRIIPEYDYKPELIVPEELAPVETQVAAEPEALISGEQFEGIEQFVDVETTKYSSDMFDFDDNKEE